MITGCSLDNVEYNSDNGMKFG